MASKTYFAEIVKTKKVFLKKVIEQLPNGAHVATEMLDGNYKVFHYFVSASGVALAHLQNEYCEIYQEALKKRQDVKKANADKIAILLGRRSF